MNFSCLIFQFNGKICLLKECISVVINFQFWVFDIWRIFIQFFQQYIKFFFNQFDIFRTPAAKLTHKNVIPSIRKKILSLRIFCKCEHIRALNTIETKLAPIIFVCKIILFFARPALKLNKLNLTAIMATIWRAYETCVNLLLIKATITFTFDN